MAKQKKYFLTPEGYKKLKEELHRLREIDMVNVAEKIKAARELDADILENNVYDAAVEEQVLMENRIAEIEDILSNAKVVENSDKSKVDLGDVVVVKTEDDTHEFKLVGSEEADPEKKHISHESPLGKALLGAKVGDTVEVETPATKVRYTIVEIK